MLMILLAAAILAAIVLAVSAPSGRVADREGRIRYLSSLGWEADGESEEAREILLPRKFEGVMRDYADMQRKAGYDLERYAGRYCENYTYRIVNYPNTDQTVLCCLFVLRGKVIGGDIHSTALDGFMHALR